MHASIRRILVPVDFSEHAREALLYAVRLAAPLEADVDALHVDAEADAATEHVVVPGHPDRTIAQELDDRARAELDAFLRSVRAHVPLEVRVAARVRRGDAARIIVEESEDYDLVLMGRHGRTALLHLLVGSVTEKVLRHARCPVLTVRHRALAASPLAAGIGITPG
jgi:nucleotide-binding universal stress UspA family protein